MQLTFRRTARVAGRFAAAVLLTLAASADFATRASAHEVKVGDLTLEHPWTRATPAGAAVAGGYTVIHNAGSTPDRLVGGTATFSETVEVHEMSMDNGVMKMRQLADGLEIPAGGEVALEPGSFHLMFIGLKQPLKEGDKVAGTLVFEKAGSVDVEWKVEAMGAKEPMHMDHTQ